MRFSKPTTSDGVLLIAALLLAPAWPSLAQNPGPGVNLLTNASFEDQQHGGVTGWVSREWNGPSDALMEGRLARQNRHTLRVDQLQ